MKKIYLILTVCALVVLIVLVNRNMTVITGLYAALFTRSSDQSLTQQISQVFSGESAEQRLYALLSSLETDTAAIDRFFSLESNTIELSARIPQGKPMEWIVWHLTQLHETHTYTIADCVYDPGDDACTITYTSKHQKKPDMVLHISYSERYMSEAGTIAVVIRHFRFDTTKRSIGFLSFAKPLNVTISPAAPQPYALASRIAEKYHKEVLISLPLEPRSLVPKELAGTTVMVHYTKERIKRIMTHAMDLVPNFSGITNDMGSRAMQDSRCMRQLLRIIKAHHGYFLEQGDIYGSKVRAIARDIGCPYEEIDIVVPDTSSPQHVRRLLRTAIHEAHTYGSCILRVPQQQAVITALNDMQPVFSRNGISFAHISTLAR